MSKVKTLLVILIALAASSFAAYGQTARLQVIHNAADPAAEKVDIYLNGSKLLDDFAFRAATPFIDAPANQEIAIGVAPGTSGSAADIIATFKVTLMEGKKYIAVANGVLNPSSFAPNPDGKNTAFNLFIKEDAQESATVSGNVEFAVMHGSTDAPTVDIVARGVATLVDDAPYTAITDYISVPAADYTIDIKDASGTVTVATFSAPLSGLANGAAFVLASGFLNPASNQDGKAFGVLAVLPDGTVIELPAITTARLQVIHNAPDPAAAAVDIYLNNAKLLDDFKFRTATPFIDAPANQVIEIGVAPGNSMSANDIIAKFSYQLLAGETYVAIANGVLNPAQFDVIPDGRVIDFGILINAQAREKGTGSNVDFFIVHNSTDAPTVDVAVSGGGPTLATGLGYAMMTDYISVPAARYLIRLSKTGDGSIINFYDVDLSGLAGESAVVLASGFVDPSKNQNGQRFALIGVLANGQVVNFPDPPTSVTGFAESKMPTQFELQQNYPNPFNPTTTISFSIPNSEFVKLSIYNTLGQQVATLVNEQLNAGQYKLLFDASNLVSGIYYYRIEAGNFSSTKRLVLLR